MSVDFFLRWVLRMLNPVFGLSKEDFLMVITLDWF